MKRKANIAYPTEFETIVIRVPRNVSTDINSYNFFSKLSEDTYGITEEVILLDFIDNEWFDINACAILGAIINGLIVRYNNVDFKNQSPDVDELFQKNQFYKTIFHDPYDELSSYNSLMPCASFNKTDSNKFVTYVDEGLLSMSVLPKMTSQLKKKINERLLEIFSNAHEHGNCGLFYSSGEYSQKKNKISVTLCNMGNTIRSNVNNFLNSKVTGVKALEWAVEEGNTTRQGSIPGGLGISLLREFLFHNGGYLEIISCNGFWKEKLGEVITETLSFRFSGTIVNIVINIDDKNTYKLASEQ